MMMSHFAAALAAAASVAALTLGGGEPGNAATRPTTIITHEGTNFGAFVSPMRDRILINLQGALWSLPMAGGQARPITDDLLEPVMLDWSPDGGKLVMQAYIDGMFHLWTLNPDGGGRLQLTKGDWDDLEPRWSPDGSQIAFVSDRAGNRDLWIMDVATGVSRQITFGAGLKTGADVSAMAGSPAWISDPGWSPDGQRMVGGGRGGGEEIDLRTRTVRRLVSDGGYDMAAPAYAPDGRHVSYETGGRLWAIDPAGGAPARVGDKTDVFPFPAVWLSAQELLYTANGRIWRSKLSGGSEETPFTAALSLQRPDYSRKVYDFDDEAPHPVKGMVGPQLSPDGRRVVFKALNDLWILDIGGGVARRLTHDTYYEVDPVWSPDGHSIAYASDKAGTQDLYTLNVETGAERRITSAQGAEVAPAWSPDGQALAYETQDGDLNLLDLVTGRTRILAAGLKAPGRPSWSPDGKVLSLAVLDDAKNHILTINVSTGAKMFSAPAPERSISTRGDDGPIWTADGKAMLFSMGSTLWLQPVTAMGQPLGPGRQLTREASDAPSIAANGDILYLHNGMLRRLAAGGETPQTVETGLTWRAEKPVQRLVVKAGRLWDGVHEATIPDADILIIDNRIKAIGKRGQFDGEGAKIVDATGLTVTPGLFDMHNHQQMRSKFLGDRQGRAWLAYGVTSTRSTGDQVYRALEDKEALASGDRIGPRYFMTGEMFEGRRLEWEFARPVDSREQLALDLSRAEDLGFDVIKTYVRFPFDWQAEVIRAAHERMGISVTSHYLYPGVAHGIDGEEHLGGPTRWGFSEISSRGELYEDVFETLTRNHFQVTTTNFWSATGLADDPALVADPRLRALYPSWEYRDLLAKLACAQGRGPCGFLPPDEALSASTVKTFTRLLRGGALVMAGTDSPLDSYALSLQLNLRSMAKHGMTPFETLQIATMNPAKAQGVDKDLGSVEAGKIADLVFVRGDPSKNINDLTRIDMVMSNGRLFSVAELLKPFAPSPSAKISGDADSNCQGPTVIRYSLRPTTNPHVKQMPSLTPVVRSERRTRCGGAAS